MLSQMNLRFPKSLIAALKNRGADEAVPVNTLDQLYRKIVRTETVDGQALSRAELCWLFTQVQIAYCDGRGPVNRMPLSALLLITGAQLERPAAIAAL